MKQLVIITIFILFQVSVFGQSNNPCGTQLSQDDYNSIKTTLLERGSIGETKNISNNISPIQTTIRVKLKAHIIRRSNGTGGLSNLNFQQSIQQLQADYVQANIRFEMCEVNYIDNDAYFNEILLGASEVTMGRENIEENAVNIFFVPNAVFTANSPYAINWSYYPISLANNLNWTIITNSYATDGGTLSHEIGHYFNLIHTHGPTSNSNEHVTRNSLKGCLKNCDTTGDLLCDTPADPNLDPIFDWPATAEYVTKKCQFVSILSLTDACGMHYNPDVKNIMSYAYNCRSHFSNGQITRMREAITIDRPEVIFDIPQNLTITSVIENGREVYSALNTINASNTIEATGRATYISGYQINLLQGFTAKYGSVFDGIIGSDCNPIGINPIYNEVKREVNTTTHTLNENDVTIYPIPVKDKATITFSLQNDVDNIDIGLYDLTGFLVKKLAKETSYKKGKHNVILDVSGMKPKVYVVIFKTSEGERIIKKIIVR